MRCKGCGKVLKSPRMFCNQLCWFRWQSKIKIKENEIKKI